MRGHNDSVLNYVSDQEARLKKLVELAEKLEKENEELRESLEQSRILAEKYRKLSGLLGQMDV